MTLPELIAKIESDNNQYAIRFEPHVFARKADAGLHRTIREANKCSLATASIIRSCSWGLYQIMGFNLYGPLQLRPSVGQFMSEPEMQVVVFEMFCEINHIWRDGDIRDADDAWLAKFAHAYNGPGNVPAYVQRMKDHMRG